jgi:hypothetical protein
LLGEIAHKKRVNSRNYIFQEKIENFNTQLRQITTNILEIKKSFFIIFGFKVKKIICTLLLAIA